ncbi:MAG: hypothetical protein LBO04_06020, partial [Spirochaetaceae bacterium]|nr:hypothetical protein [Spirochaetaceae bacterium]
MRVRVFWLIVPAMALVSLFASCENADGHIEFMQDELSKPGFGAEVQVTPASVILVKGGRQKFTVEGTGKVNWTVSGAKNAGTSIDGTGLLTTSPDEGAQRLTVVVTAGGNKSGRAYVYLVEPGEKNGITVRPGIIALGPGETQTFEADYSGNGGLDWAVLDAASSTVTQSGELTVDAGETAEEFSVKASLTGNGGVNGTARITVLGSGENPLPINNGIQVAPQAKNVAKGRTATFKALAFNETSGAFEELTDGVSWHLFGGAAGSLIDVNSGGLAVSENETANHLTVRARMTNDSACYGTAVVTVIGDGGQDVGGEGGGGQEGGNNSTPITFIGLTANGAEYTEATTELGLEFSAGINGLSADDITITPAGAAVKGLVSGSGGIYSLGLSGVNEETEIEVAVAKEGYAVTPSSKTVTVHGVAALLTFDSLTANGAANTATTTELTLGFSAAIDGLSADDITITPAGAAVKGTLSGKNGIYMLGVDGISAETEISVAVSKAGHVFTPSSKTVTAHFSSSNFANKARTFESLTANDAPTTTELTLEFNGAIDGLSADDITITPEDAVVKGTLSGSNGTYRLGISAVLSQEQETEISVGVSRAGYTIDPSSKTVTVYRAFASVSFTGLTANGAANAATTTELTLSFSAEIDGLSAGNISIAPAGAVVKGSLSGSGGTYRLSLSGVSAEREIEVAVAKAGYTITPSSKTVTVHKTPVAVSFTALTANGSGNTATTELTFQFSAAIDGLSADDITITPSNAAVKGTLGGSNGTYTLGVSGIISTDAETEISVGVSKAGYTINPSSKTVTVRRVPVVVSFTGLTVNGAANTATTTALTLGFSAGISGLSADDITITPAGALTKGALGGSGGTYTLAVSG